jgi:iron-sulfur cluster repair protein YtfE (RIC family)
MSASDLLAILDDMSVNAVIQAFPATVAVFNEFGIDACCGGAAPIREAAIRDGANPDMLLEALIHGTWEPA